MRTTMMIALAVAVLGCGGKKSDGGGGGGGGKAKDADPAAANAAVPAELKGKLEFDTAVCPWRVAYTRTIELMRPLSQEPSTPGHPCRQIRPAVRGPCGPRGS
jgi:hypothetical protein